MKTILRILVIAVVAFAIVVITVLYAIYESEPSQQGVLEDQTFDEDIEEMIVRVENSRVDFRASDDDTARVVLSGNSEDFTLDTELSDGRLTIEVDDRTGFFMFNFNRFHSLQVYIPENGVNSLAIESDNGTIQAIGIGADEVTVEADNARIEMNGVVADSADIETDNGAIELRDMEAELSVRSSNGRIIFTDVSGELQAQANNGRIELTAETLDFPVDFETDNGRIEVRTEHEPTNARIDADVNNGSIDIYGQDSSRITFGDGDVLIRLVSRNGSIEVK